MISFSLNRKISFLLAVSAVAGFVIYGIGLRNMNFLKESLDEIVQHQAARVIIAQDMALKVTEIRIEEKNIILLEGSDNKLKSRALLDNLEKELMVQLAEAKKLVGKSDQQDFEAIEQNLTEWKPISMQVRELALMGKQSDAFGLALGGSRDTLLKISDTLKGIKERNQLSMKEVIASTAARFVETRRLIYGVSVVVLLISIMVAFFVIRSLSRAIDIVIADLRENSVQLTEAAQQISSSSEQLSLGAGEHATSLEGTSSAIEEMQSMIKKNADTASKSSEISKASGESAQRGKKVVEEMQTAMVDIDFAIFNIMRYSSSSNQKISDIVKVISEIGNKTKVINEIVFQTKLLSFNASVEAARAGEHGKGFAVVAEEVGNLAQMSGNAAKEITSMLDTSIEKVKSIVEETKTSIECLIAESKSKVEFGSKVAANCSEVLEEIVGNVAQVSQLSRSISEATSEQARGIEEITKAVCLLDQMTKQNASVADQTAGSAEELSAQAGNMQEVVEALIHAIKGGQQRLGHVTSQPPLAA